MPVISPLNPRSIASSKNNSVNMNWLSLAFYLPFIWNFHMKPNNHLKLFGAIAKHDPAVWWSPVSNMHLTRETDGANCRLQVAGCRSGFHSNAVGAGQSFCFVVSMYFDVFWLRTKLLNSYMSSSIDRAKAHSSAEKHSIIYWKHNKVQGGVVKLNVQSLRGSYGPSAAGSGLNTPPSTTNMLCFQFYKTTIAKRFLSCFASTWDF